MRRTLFALLALTIILGYGCNPASKNPGDKYKPVLGEFEQVTKGLENSETKLNKLLYGETVPGTDGQPCVKALGLPELEQKMVDIRAKLDKLKPEDMPMRTETIQTGIDPNTKQPELETKTLIDWGKVTGPDQTIWANLHNVHTAVSASLKTAEVSCQCIESNDRESVFCSIIELQMVNGRISLDLDSLEKAHIAPVRELIMGPSGQ